MSDRIDDEALFELIDADDGIDALWSSVSENSEGLEVRSVKGNPFAKVQKVACPTNKPTAYLYVQGEIESDGVPVVRSFALSRTVKYARPSSLGVKGTVSFVSLLLQESGDTNDEAYNRLRVRAMDLFGSQMGIWVPSLEASHEEIAEAQKVQAFVKSKWNKNYSENNAVVSFLRTLTKPEFKHIPEFLKDRAQTLLDSFQHGE